MNVSDWIESIGQDVRHGLRRLRKSPGFTLVAVVTLAVGIGANTAIFSIVNVVLLKPLPYEDPSRLLSIVENVPLEETLSGIPARMNMTPEDTLELRTTASALSDVSAYNTQSMTLSGRGTTLMVQIGQLSASMLPMLGVAPLMGRVFESDEERSGADALVILSDAAWRKYWAADSGILGQTATLDGREFAIIGVMPPDFEFPNSATEFWKPLVLAPSAPAPRRGAIRRYATVARLEGGASVEAATVEVNMVLGNFLGLPQPDAPSRSGDLPRWEVAGIEAQRAAPLGRALLILTVAVGLVLLIACANVANLLLARTATQRREIAIRAALGAGRGRLVRQILTESMMLALARGAAGIVVALGGVEMVMAYWPGNINLTPDIPRLDNISLDSSVFAFTLAASILTGILFGLVPALRISGSERSEALKAFAAHLRPNRTRSVLVIAQVGMAMVLLAGGGLLIHSFLKLSNVDPGFDPTQVLTFQVALPPAAGGGQRQALNEELVERLQARSDVQFAGYSTSLPLETSDNRASIQIPGVTREAMLATGGVPRMLSVSREYLRAAGLRLIAGRWFDENDGPTAAPVLLINREFAKRFFGGDNPVGTFVMSLGSTPSEIVGIVDDVRQRGLNTQPEAQFFLETNQLLARVPAAVGISQMVNIVYFAVRAEGNPMPLVPRIHGILDELDSRAALHAVSTLEAVVSNSIAGPRFYAALVASFAAVAAVLAGIGIYGVVAYSVTQRTREIGIRMALGASRRDVLTFVMRQGFILAAAGIVLGLAAAAGVTRYLDSMLFGLTPLDPITMAGISVIFVLITLVGCYVPARRATKVDPIVALRHD